MNLDKTKLISNSAEDITIENIIMESYNKKNGQENQALEIKRRKNVT